MEKVEVTNDKGVSCQGIIIGSVREGETTYAIAVSEHGGIWYRGDWVGEKWAFLSEQAFRERFAFLARNTLDDPNNLKQIKRELDSFRIPVCPSCGRDWSKRLPPFRKLPCQACKAHKQAAIEWAGHLFEAKAINLRNQRQILTPAECHAKAVADREILYD